jgi:hypothetical protein
VTCTGYPLWTPEGLKEWAPLAKCFFFFFLLMDSQVCFVLFVVLVLELRAYTLNHLSHSTSPFLSRVF